MTEGSRTEKEIGRRSGFFASLWNDTKKEPNPLTPFPVKEGGTENLFYSLPWKEGGTENLFYSLPWKEGGTENLFYSLPWKEGEPRICFIPFLGRKGEPRAGVTPGGLQWFIPGSVVAGGE
jgi:hypothetical protein